MKQKTLNVLEYSKIIEMLSAQAGSKLTAEVISELRPVMDIREIREKQQETTEAVRLIQAKGPLPVGGFYDIEGSVKFARKGGVLTMAQLLKVLYNMKTAEQVVKFLKGDNVPELPLISEIAEILVLHKGLSEEIDRCIISEDEMSDNASPELRRLRRAIHRQGEAMRARLDQIVSSSANQGALQDTIITMRNGRYVIPVKAEAKSRFPGIIHDQSSTGSTVFIEPQVIVNMNNELKQMELDEKAEINRILTEFSEAVSEAMHELINNQKLLLELDLFMAKGKLSIDMRGEEPLVGDDGIIDLRAAEHPLIDKKKVVPVNISIGENYKTLVVTGPNTGGKTVTLKTAGLLTLMAQTGLHIPVAPGSRVSIFEDVYADIGDEQSIEQSLSTFSSHMANIVDIMKNANGKSLILLDELGAGTDPTEGAALAISILEALGRQGATILATTHYTELKKFAISTEGVENASMEFDVETLSPTYKLTIGLPGKSNAFEISKKLGLSDSITDRATELLSTGDIVFEDVISSIEADKKAAEAERYEAIRITREMKEKQAQLEREVEKAKERNAKAIEDAKEEARAIVREAKEVSEEVKDELKELAKLESLGERNKGYDRARKRLKELEKKNRTTLKVETNNNPVDPSKLKIGDRVKVLTIGQNGELISLPDDRGEVQVQVGIMKINASIEDIMYVGNNTPAKKPKTSKYGKLYRQKAQVVSTSVDVRGKNLDEAIMDVGKYLDDAFISGLNEVTIIHGRGEGILSKGIRAELRRIKNVKEYRRGSFNEGGDGVTVVKFK